MPDIASELLDMTYDVTLHADGTTDVVVYGLPRLRPGRYWQAAPGFPWVRLSWWGYWRLRRSLQEGERLMRID